MAELVESTGIVAKIGHYVIVTTVAVLIASGGWRMSRIETSYPDLARQNAADLAMTGSQRQKSFILANLCKT